MFEKLESLPGDPILSIMAAFRQDTSDRKVDLSAGVYKDVDGQTPVMNAVSDAEQVVLAEQTSKAYIGLAGNAAFNQAQQLLLLGPDHPAIGQGRAHTFQTPGGSGGLRVAAEFFKSIRPDARVWLSDPSWPNHEPLIKSAGIDIQRYPYLDKATGGILFDEMMAALGEAQPGDLLLLHSCCHNPSGADLSAQQWAQVVALCEKNNLVPFIDAAYQGFGDGLDEDAAGLRLVAQRLPECVIVASCSKNFGLYKERVGSVTLVAASPGDADIVLSHMLRIVRRIYSMPPDHGAAIVATILGDPALRINWEEELAECRDRMKRLRTELRSELERAIPGEDFTFLTDQKGMFSMLPVTVAEAQALREQHHVYLVDSGRINVAGLPENGLAALADAVASVKRG
ncbi:MAG: amino acid aminotransferase [Pseudomonadota bacterium]